VFTSRTVTAAIGALTPEQARLTIATYLLGQMIATGGLKEDKVRAAFEYADMLISQNEQNSSEKDK
jgi:hypothetical protein